MVHRWFKCTNQIILVGMRIIRFSWQAQECFSSFLHESVPFARFWPWAIRSPKPSVQSSWEYRFAFLRSWCYQHTSASSPWLLLTKITYPCPVDQSHCPKYEYAWHNLDTRLSCSWGLGFSVRIFGLIPGGGWIVDKVGRFWVREMVLGFEVGYFGLKHVDLVVFRLDFGLEPGVVLLQFEELFWLGAAWAPFFGQALNLCAQNDNLEGELVRKLSLLFELLLHGLVVPFVALNVTDQSHDMILTLHKKIH